jgi:hypothetical protein
MHESMQHIRWISQLRGAPILYIVISIPVVMPVTMAYFLGLFMILPKVPDWTFYGLVVIWLPWISWMVVIITGPDGTWPAKVEAAAERLGLSFANRPVAGELALPLEFPLARSSARWLFPGRRSPRNLIHGMVGGRTVWVFDIAYPMYMEGRLETTAAYFPDAVHGLPDWPAEWARGPYPGETLAPEPFASVLAPHAGWTVSRGANLHFVSIFFSAFSAARRTSSRLSLSNSRKAGTASFASGPTLPSASAAWIRM